MRRRLLVIALTIAGLLVVSPAVAGAATPVYAALGDSYSSGLGTGTYTLDATCKRGTKAYPALYGVDPSRFAACSGADIAAVTGQLSVAQGASLVTLTVGGNDIGFSDVVSKCNVFNTNATCTNAVNTAVAKIPAMQGNLETLLKKIRTTAVSARILLLGYPYLYRDTITGCGLGQPSYTQRKALHDGAVALDKALGDAVTNVGDGNIKFVDVRTIFTGHDICAGSTQRWINGLNLLNTAESYHPNAAGHAYGYLPAMKKEAPVATAA